MSCICLLNKNLPMLPIVPHPYILLEILSYLYICIMIMPECGVCVSEYGFHVILFMFIINFDHFQTSVFLFFSFFIFFVSVLLNVFLFYCLVSQNVVCSFLSPATLLQSAVSTYITLHTFTPYASSSSHECVFSDPYLSGLIFQFPKSVIKNCLLFLGCLEVIFYIRQVLFFCLETIT